jgi:hypothetical protein
MPKRRASKILSRISVWVIHFPTFPRERAYLKKTKLNQRKRREAMRAILRYFL